MDDVGNNDANQQHSMGKYYDFSVDPSLCTVCTQRALLLARKEKLQIATQAQIESLCITYSKESDACTPLFRPLPWAFPAKCQMLV